jgi:hypothetical protein
MHFLTLFWDHGFQKSSLKSAEIFEKFRRSRSLAGSLFEGVNGVARRLGNIANRISHPDIGKIGRVARSQDYPSPRDSGFGKTAQSFCFVRLRVNGL